jgi:excisionase family DNA binding protein
MKNLKLIPEALPEGDYLVGVSQLESFLGVSPPTCRKIIKTRKIPFYKIGGKYFFEKDKIRASIEKGGQND